MANKTNCTKKGSDYYRIKRTVGKKLNKAGLWVDDKREFYGKNKKEAMSKYEEFKKLRESGIESTDILFSEMIEFFIYNVLMVDSTFTSGTKERYESVYRNYIKNASIGGMLLHKVKSFDVQKMYNDLQCSYATIKAVNSVMQHFYQYMEREHVCRDITNSLVIPNKDKKCKNQEIVVWTDGELNKIIDGLDSHRLRLLVMLAINTGCRVSELLALQYSDFQDGQIRITKQLLSRAEFNGTEKNVREPRIEDAKTESSIRNIPLMPYVFEEIRLHSLWHKEEMMKNSYRTDFVFTTKAGRPYERHNISTALKRFYKQIDIPYKSFHTYRHTFCTNLCLNGANLETAANLLGHNSVNVTAKYYRNVGDSEKRNAIEAMFSNIRTSDSR